MQLDLFASFPFPAGSWARKARNQGTVVIWISDLYAAAENQLAGKLAAAGARAVGCKPLGGSYAYCLDCPSSLATLLLSTVPLPPSAGSRTSGNLLPW